MSFSYSGDPAASNLDEVRYRLGDTDSTNPLLTDEEIQFQINTWVLDTTKGYTNTWAAAECAETIAARFAREVSYSADGVSVGGNELQTKYTELAGTLRSQYDRSQTLGGPDAGGMIQGEEFDSTIKPLSFSKGMHDNRRAGQQEYGGEGPYLLDPGIYGTYGTGAM